MQGTFVIEALEKTKNWPPKTGTASRGSAENGFAGRLVR
jgi:hypothetical protein